MNCYFVDNPCLTEPYTLCVVVDHYIGLGLLLGLAKAMLNLVLSEDHPHRHGL